MHPARTVLLAVATACIVPSLQSAVAVDFSTEIRPLLSDKCFQCHGPDAESRKADLRLDIREAAVDFGAIVPGSAAASSIIERITSTDRDLVMPPPATDKTMTPAEIKLLTEWINEDAPYAGHYAFSIPERPDPPAVEPADWPKNAIDHFVLAKLNDKDLEPSAQADRRTLIRRLSFDLVGLPPTPEEVQQFVDDDSPEAIGKLIERLLASPHYGERWARWWLDAARYADSDGYEKDKPREVWFYRDWVIRSLNNDKPYDRFVIEQVAGDLLPDAGQDERVATGFLRNSMVNEEGGADPEQFRVEGMFDRMDAIGKSILGITTQCAQCHTHKYDPLTQQEYYQMFACLNDFHEGMETVYTSAEQQQRQTTLDQIAAIEEKLKADTPDWEQRMSAWEAAVLVKQPKWTTVVPTDRPFEGQKFRPLDDGSIISESYAPTKNAATFRLDMPAKAITAYRIELLTHPQLPRSGPGRSIYGTGALSEFNVEVTPADAKKIAVKWDHALAEINPGKRPLAQPYLEKDAKKDNRTTGPIEFAIDGDEKTAWRTDIDPGRRNRSRQAVFVADRPAAIGDSETMQLAITLVQKHGGWNSDDNQNYLMGRYRFSVTTDDVSELEIVPLEVLPILAKPISERTPEEIAQVFSHWRTTVPEFADQNAQIEAAWQQHPEGHSQLTAITKGTPRDTHVMLRGDFLSPGEQVEPGVPAFLNAWPDSSEPPRLRFARWLVADDSPTAARTVINRVWQAYFGRGLVTSPEDLGYQSPPPSHPQLLDWLARELMDNGWSLKHIHRLIATSATYQQSANLSPELLEKDLYNSLLARGPRFRINAEAVRDTALAISGLLSEEVGGPSVYPDAPSFLFVPPASYGPKQWPVSTGGAQYRRSLYVHQYRSVPFPALQVFDAPKGDAACVRRERSNTPLQALVLLNEPQFIECATAFGDRIRTAAKTDDDRIRFAFRTAVARDPDSVELEALQTLLTQQRQHSTSASEDPTIAESNLWTIIARVILNLDETITKP